MSRPASAISAVSRTRSNSVTTQRSIRSSARAVPSARACTRPSSVNGQATPGSPLTSALALSSDSPWRAARSLLTGARSGSRGRAPSRRCRRAGSRRRCRPGRRGRRSAPARAAAGSGRAGPRPAFPARRASGSVQTCCSCTACGVHADASALKRITPSSSQSHERPSSICARVRQRKPSASRRRGSIPSSPSCASAQAGTSRSRSANVAARRPLPPGSGAADIA